MFTVECYGDHLLEVSFMASGSSAPDRPILRVEQRLCLHCQEYLSFKTYKTHKHISSSGQWISKAGNSSDTTESIANETAPTSSGEPATFNQDDDPSGTSYEIVVDVL